MARMARVVAVGLRQRHPRLAACGPPNAPVGLYQIRFASLSAGAHLRGVDPSEVVEWRAGTRVADVAI